jgi:hypothetical protein
VAEAVTLPPGNTLNGRPVALLSLVSAIQERRQQVEAVHAYWRLAQAVAEYRFCFDEDQQLGRMKPRAEETADWRAAQAASAARLREAEVEATSAQIEVATLMASPVDSPLPLPADHPHVGVYRTFFSELFGSRPAPPRAAAIDRTLPLRSRAIEAHAAAVQAASEALDAALSAQSSGQGRLATVLANLSDYGRQRRAFMASVCRYNHDIADYALAVVGEPTTPDVLVGMLIKLNRETVHPALPGEEGATQPASYQEPLPATTSQPVRKNWPTRAIRPPAPKSADPEPNPQNRP